jgi:hypothetical protein
LKVATIVTVRVTSALELFAVPALAAAAAVEPLAPGSRPKLS